MECAYIVLDGTFNLLPFSRLFESDSQFRDPERQNQEYGFCRFFYKFSTISSDKLCSLPARFWPLRDHLRGVFFCYFEFADAVLLENGRHISLPAPHFHTVISHLVHGA